MRIMHWPSSLANKTTLLRRLKGLGYLQNSLLLKSHVVLQQSIDFSDAAFQSDLYSIDTLVEICSELKVTLTHDAADRASQQSFF